MEIKRISKEWDVFEEVPETGLQINTTINANERAVYRGHLWPANLYFIIIIIRISKLKKRFEKRYTTNWTEEVFKIV